MYPFCISKINYDSAKTGRKFVTSSLEKLKIQVKSGQLQPVKGKAKAYFNSNIEEIMNLASLGVPYKEIIKAMDLDGVKVSEAYFRRLISQAKKERVTTTTPFKGKSDGTKSSSSNEKSYLNPLLDKEKILAKIKEIQSSNMSIKEKRDAIEHVTKPLENLNPLRTKSKF